jgi:dTDP-D-glucose 4,6-dehydratase
VVILKAVAGEPIPLYGDGKRTNKQVVEAI